MDYLDTDLDWNLDYDHKDIQNIAVFIVINFMHMQLLFMIINFNVGHYCYANYF